MARRNTSYAKRLQHPAWQKKRLGVLQRADWRCEWCGTGEVNLQVHHGYYHKDFAPWDYHDDSLFCLCDHCHEKAEKARSSVYIELGRLHPKYHAQVYSLLQDVHQLIEQEEDLTQAQVIKDAPQQIKPGD